MSGRSTRPSCAASCARLARSSLHHISKQQSSSRHHHNNDKGVINAHANQREKLKDKPFLLCNRHIFIMSVIAVRDSSYPQRHIATDLVIEKRKGIAIVVNRSWTSNRGSVLDDMSQAHFDAHAQRTHTSAAKERLTRRDQS